MPKALDSGTLWVAQHRFGYAKYWYPESSRRATCKFHPAMEPALALSAADASRPLSPHHMFFQMALEHKPECAFGAALEAGQSFADWKAQTLPRVLATLLNFPERPPLNPVLLGEWEDDGLRKQRWLIDVHKHLSATFQINYPGDLAPGEKRPTLLCWHGHGKFGKEPVMGSKGSPDVERSVEIFNYNYGHQMAKAGFVTYAIDWIGGGERSDANWPNHLSSIAGGRDWCNLYYLQATMFGYTSLSINLTHGKAATDFACSLPGVDPDRLGVMGLSGGGTMALWTALLDERFSATEIICYSDLWALFGMRDYNYCGMQVAPGLFSLVDLPDLQGLLAPRPLLIDIGAYDSCFRIDGSMACYRQLERIYQEAGAAADLHLDLFPSEHAWGGRKSVEFFGKYLSR